MAGELTISNLTAHAIIGVRSEEQALKQALIIDLSFSVDIDRAASRDLLIDTYDYAAICHEIVSFVEKTPCRLLETLLKKLSLHLMNQFNLQNLQLKITKKPMDLLGVEVGVDMDNIY